VSWSPTLFSGSGPIRLPPVPWTEKTIERSPFFIRRGGHCCCGDLVGWTTFWIFFEWLAEVRAVCQEISSYNLFLANTTHILIIFLILCVMCFFVPFA
jgi:hypothetical protein